LKTLKTDIWNNTVLVDYIWYIRLLWLTVRYRENMELILKVEETAKLYNLVQMLMFI